MNYLKKYPLTCICILAIWYLCFFTPPKTELENVPFIDKWVHIAMYGGTCSIIWLEYWRKHTIANMRKLLLLAVVGPIAMSGIIELLQAYCTTNRSGDWLDLLANSIGVVLAALLGNSLYKNVMKKWKKNSDSL